MIFCAKSKWRKYAEELEARCFELRRLDIGQVMAADPAVKASIGKKALAEEHGYLTRLRRFYGLRGPVRQQ